MAEGIKVINESNRVRGVLTIKSLEAPKKWRTAMRRSS